MRLINLDKFPLLQNKLEEDLTEYERGYLDAQSNLNALPDVDAEPVRHGHWDKGHEMMTCTNCCEQFDLYFKNDFNYCPNCGAKMDEDIEIVESIDAGDRGDAGFGSTGR